MRDYLVSLHELFSGYLEVVCGVPPKHQLVASRGLRNISVSDRSTISGATSEIAIFIKYRGKDESWKIGMTESGELCGDIGSLTTKNYEFLRSLYVNVLSMACDTFGAIKSVDYSNSAKTVEILYENWEKDVINVRGYM